MGLTVTFQRQTCFELSNGRHAVISDQPKEDGGDDAGMSPVELFVASLAGCVGYFVARYCMRHRISPEGFRIDTDWSMAEQPHRVGRIQLRLHLPSGFPSSEQETLLKVAHGCTVHQSIVRAPTIDIVLQEVA
jgi:putative redox protein